MGLCALPVGQAIIDNFYLTYKLSHNFRKFIHIHALTDREYASENDIFEIWINNTLMPAIQNTTTDRCSPIGVEVTRTSSSRNLN